MMKKNIAILICSVVGALTFGFYAGMLWQYDLEQACTHFGSFPVFKFGLDGMRTTCFIYKADYDEGRPLKRKWSK